MNIKIVSILVVLVCVLSLGFRLAEATYLYCHCCDIDTYCESTFGGAGSCNDFGLFWKVTYNTIDDWADESDDGGATCDSWDICVEGTIHEGHCDFPPE